MSRKLHITTVFLVCLIAKVSLDPRFPSLTCFKLCKCEVDTNNRITAKCNLNGLNSSALTNIQWPKDLFSLDLSSSGLEKLPTSFTHKLSNISNLNLSNNSLVYMTKESFRELKELRTLDLSHSKLWPWKFPSNESSKLETIYVKEAYLLPYYYYWPDILSIPSIETVRDVKWLDACDQCNITKMIKPNITSFAYKNYSKTRIFQSKGYKPENSNGDTCLYYESLMKRDLLGHLRPGFALECWCDLQRCAIDVAQKLEQIYRFPRALRFSQRLLDCLYPLASVALVFNSIVISFILTSNDLRKSPTMLLILNMAVCDVFMTIWCVLTITFNNFLDSDEDVRNFNLNIWKDSAYVDKYCLCMAFIYGVTQITAVVTSIFLVVEKYLVIVYSMRPELRITKRVAIVSMAITWCVVNVYFVYAVFLVNRDKKPKHLEQNLFLCATSGRETKLKLFPELPFSVYLGWIGFILVCCTIPLYIHIYIVVRKSSNQMGIKREGTLAKRLAILILTNLLFSTLPFSIIPFVSNQLSFSQLSSKPKLMKTLLISSVWVPIFLLCINSCLNPYLFAFRNHLFQRRFSKYVQEFLPCFQKKLNPNTDQQMCQQSRCNRVVAKQMDVDETRL